MGFSLKNVARIAPIAAVAPSVIGGVGTAALLGKGLFGGGGTDTVSQVPLRTPEQEEADRLLLQYAKTGKFGNFDANGGAFKGSLGNFDLSGMERDAIERVGAAGREGPSPLMDAGSGALMDFLNTDQYDPYNPNGQFKALSEGIDRNTREAQDGLKRNLAVTGNLYSSTNARESGRIEEGAAISKNQELSRLADEFLQRKLSAIPLAFQGAESEEAMRRGRNSDAINFGGIERGLKDAEAQRRYQDFIRLRQEAGLPVDALKAVSGASAQFGVPSVTMPKEDPWAQTLQLLAGIGGQAFGQLATARTGGAASFANPGAPTRRYA